MIERTRNVPGERTHDYSWDADRTTGFEKSTFIYDAEGHLIGVDYSPARAVPREEPVDTEKV